MFTDTTGTAEGVILLTADKDFGELVFRQDEVARGIVLIRIAGLSPAIKVEIIAADIKDHGDWVFEVIYGDYFGQCENPTESFHL
ncbi:MAG: DUF5615 family PIN-like protein [Methanosarcinales archaeon]|nr:DUF5615 family PIN-like protein [Methanosarcinales archaeon]